MSNPDPTLTESHEQTGHTPGPWRLDERFPGKVYCDDDLGSLVADCGPFRFTITERHAEASFNAHLIAAAPELLKQLRLALSVVEECDPDTVREYAPDIRAAISKALPVPERGQGPVDSVLQPEAESGSSLPTRPEKAREALIEAGSTLLSLKGRIIDHPLSRVVFNGEEITYEEMRTRTLAIIDKALSSLPKQMTASAEEEQIEIIRVTDIPRERTIENLRWLVPMALDAHQVKALVLDGQIFPTAASLSEKDGKPNAISVPASPNPAPSLPVAEQPNQDLEHK